MKRVCWLALSVCAALALARTSAERGSGRARRVGGRPLRSVRANTRFTPEGLVVESAGLAGPRPSPARTVVSRRWPLSGSSSRGASRSSLIPTISGAGDSRFSSRFMTVGVRYRPASRIWLERRRGPGLVSRPPGPGERPDSAQARPRARRSAGVETLHCEFFCAGPGPAREDFYREVRRVTSDPGCDSAGLQRVLAAAVKQGLLASLVVGSAFRLRAQRFGGQVGLVGDAATPRRRLAAFGCSYAPGTQ